MEFDQEVEFDAGPIVGARALFPVGERWSIGAGYGYASYAVTFRVSTVIEPEGVVVEDDAGEHLYYGTVEHAPVLADPVGVHLLGELGGATYSPDGGRSTTDLLAGFGAGLDFRAHERATVRVNLRDHLRFCSDVLFAFPANSGGGSQVRPEEEALCDEDQILHNLELSVGIRLRF